MLRREKVRVIGGVGGVVPPLRSNRRFRSAAKSEIFRLGVGSAGFAHWMSGPRYVQLKPFLYFLAGTMTQRDLLLLICTPYASITLECYEEWRLGAAYSALEVHFGRGTDIGTAGPDSGTSFLFCTRWTSPMPWSRNLKLVILHISLNTKFR